METHLVNLETHLGGCGAHGACGGPAPGVVQGCRHAPQSGAKRVPAPLCWGTKQKNSDKALLSVQKIISKVIHRKMISIFFHVIKCLKLYILPWMHTRVILLSWFSNVVLTYESYVLQIIRNILWSNQSILCDMSLLIWSYSLVCQ